MKLKLACFLIGICLLGCEPKKKESSMGGRAPEEHVHATTLPGAIKELDEHVATITKAFTSSKPDDAHDALHDVGHVLESIPGLAKSLTDVKKAAIKKSVDELFACFGALDETMHGGPETPFSKVGERITAAMSELRTATEK
jgi:hypothetical protein